jgi:DNA-binding response OmpR family regulator
MLTADGYRVMACKTAKDGIELSGRHDRPVQLLIAGFDEDGEKLARSLYSSVPALRVIWVGTHETLSPAAWLPPAQQYTLAKPFALSEVLRNVRALLDA